MPILTTPRCASRVDTDAVTAGSSRTSEEAARGAAVFAQLVPIEGGDPITIDKDVTVVGRQAEHCDIVLDRKSIALQESGHIGLAIGGRAQRELWPQACDWLAQRTN